MAVSGQHGWRHLAAMVVKGERNGRRSHGPERAGEDGDLGGNELGAE